MANYDDDFDQPEPTRGIIRQDDGLGEGPTFRGTQPTTVRSVQVESRTKDVLDDLVHRDIKSSKSFTGQDYTKQTFPLTKELLQMPFGSKDLQAFAPKEESLQASASESITKPPTAPFFLEISQLKSTKADPQKLREGLLGSFADAKSRCYLEWENPSPFRFNVTAYPVDSCSMTFIARVWAQSDSYIVEFQRRSGDVVLFVDLWDSCRRFLVRSHYVDEIELPPVKQPLPPLPSLTISDEEIHESLACLLQMASAEYDDLKVQAIIALSQMSTDAQNLKCMASSDACLKVLLSALENSDDDCHRCALTALHNLVKAKDAAAFINQNGGFTRACRVLKKTKCGPVVAQGVDFVCSLNQQGFRPQAEVIQDCVKQLKQHKAHEAQGEKLARFFLR